MGDGAGSLVYLAGSGRTLLTVNSDGSINVDFNSGVEINEFTPTIIRSRENLQVTSQSGGVTLESGDVKSVTIKFLETGSGDMNQSGYIFVGGNEGEDLPNSGHGLRLSPGDSYTVAIDNFNKIHVFATLSGEWVSYMGNQR